MIFLILLVSIVFIVLLVVFIQVLFSNNLLSYETLGIALSLFISVFIISLKVKFNKRKRKNG
jgi:hypothetical protein